MDKISRANSLLREAAELLNPRNSERLNPSNERGPSNEAAGTSGSSTEQVSPVTPMFNIQEFMLPSGSSRMTRSKRKRYSPYEKKQAMLTWTHKFVCLGNTLCETVPSGHEKYTLKCADLGEKKLVFRLNGNYSHLKEVIFQAFPLLDKAGGFELMRTEGPYSRKLVEIDSKFLVSVAKLKEFIEQARVYVRPLQADIIDLDDTHDAENECGDAPKEKCLECGKEVELSFLKTHLEVCREAKEIYKKEKEKESDDEVPPLPPKFTPTPSVNRKCSDVMSREQSNAQLTPTVLSSTPSSSTDSPATSQRLPVCYSAYISLIDDDLTEMEDEDFQTAIEASLMSGVDGFMSTVENPALSDVLQTHVRDLQLQCGIDDPHQLVTVRRKHIWSDIKRCFSKQYTDFTLPLRVIFVGEPAADQGGPKREFFRLALSSCTTDPSLFAGPVSCKVPVHNTTALLQKHYKFVGYIIAMSLVQGGPGPICFARWVFDYLAYGLESVQVRVDDVLSDSIKNFLRKLDAVEDVEGLRNLLNEDSADVVYASGFSTPITKVTLDDIPVVLKAVCIHSCIVPIKAELDQLKEGLNLFNVIDLIKKFPMQTRELFVSTGSAKLTLNNMLHLFEFSFSLEGSNAREAEEATVLHWNEFLMEVEKNLAVSTIHSMDGDVEVRPLTLEDVLVFVTGADHVPPMGFEKRLTLSFDSNSLYPTASTCSLTLYLPTRFVEYEDFKTGMIEGIVSGFGFGKA